MFHNVIGQAQVPGIIKVESSEGVIAFAEIREDGFVGVEYLDAVVQAVRVPVVHVDQEVRLITDPHLKPLAQQLEEEIVVLVQPRPEVAEINSNLPLHGR